MTVAVVGWGSLVWSPRSLVVRSRWRADGPCLPVEFARRSHDGRVTLVVVPGRPPVRTYWTVSGCRDLDGAVANLATREGCPPSAVGRLPRPASPAAPSEAGAAGEAVAAWLRDRPGLDGAVWTALPWTFAPDDLAGGVVAYLRTLRGLTRRRARAYVECAPPQTDTAVRRRVEAALGWGRAALPPEIFDGPATAAPCHGSASPPAQRLRRQRSRSGSRPCSPGW